MSPALENARAGHDMQAIAGDVLDKIVSIRVGDKISLLTASGRNRAGLSMGR